MRLEEREGVADALARAVAEGEVGEARDFLEKVTLPTFGEELFGIFIPAGVAMDNPGDGADAGSLGNGIAAEGMVFDGEASHGPRGRIEPHGFGDDVIGVGKIGKIVESGGAAFKDGGEFGVEFLFDLRILREEHPGPGEGAGGGFVSGEEEGEGFVAELLSGHAGAIFVLRMDEEREKVAGIVVGGAALLDDAVDDDGEIADSAFCAEIAAAGEPGRRHEQAAKIHGEFEKDVEIFANIGSVAVDVGVEERFGDDLEGEAHHGIVQVELLAGTPGLDEAGGAIGHGAGVIRDAIAVEGRLHHAALAEPKFAFAGEKAVAKEEAVGAEDAAFDEFTRIVDDDVFDVLGMEKGVGAEVEKAQADDVAVFAGVTRHEGKGIASKLAA